MAKNKKTCFMAQNDNTALPSTKLQLQQPPNAAFQFYIQTKETQYIPRLRTIQTKS